MRHGTTRTFRVRLRPRRSAPHCGARCSWHGSHLRGLQDTPRPDDRGHGRRVTPPGALTPLYDSGEAGKRYAWEGIVGLTGTMNCSRADAFEDFSVSIAESFRTSDDLPAVLRRFMELASASICTLAEATPNACRALTKSMTDGSLAQFKDGLAKGEAMPTGSRDFFIVNGVDAELDMTPVGISWSIGPGQAMTTDAVRQTLAPVNADK
jgi:hypothetical protein